MSVRERPHFRFGRRPEAVAPSVPEQRSDEPMLLGFPAEFADDEDDDDEPSPSAIRTDPRVVVLRRADHVAGGALILAGVAAAASTTFPWFRGEDRGLMLVERGIEEAGAGIEEFLAGGAWPPLAIVSGGVLLLLLGLLLFRPARTHRLVGVLELLVASLAAAAVVVLLARAGWTTETFDVGMWLAVAVAGLGVLGALKAMLTTPRVVLRETPVQVAARAAQ
jgi:hypothetical protein